MGKMEFYEVDGHQYFIPVKLIEKLNHVNVLEVEATESGLRTFVPRIYKFLKASEPQKVVVPKFVAEWIEELKKSRSNLAWVWEVYPNEPKIKNWLESNTETFMRAWLDGYEVEQEKLYEVTVPGTSNYKKQRQHLVKQGKNWFFCGNDINRFKYRFTKGQIEAAGFGWVFDCDGVKVVEVKDDKKST